MRIRVAIVMPALLLGMASPAAAAPGEISTVAGGWIDDGVAALEARLSRPHDVAVAPDGRVAIADAGTGRVRVVAPDGTIGTLAGTGSAYGPNGDGGPATQARLGSIESISFGPDGSLYIADVFATRVRRVDPTGVISTFAGGGDADPRDGGPATDVRLGYWITDVHAAADGSVLISDYSDSTVWRVTPDGMIDPFVGTGYHGFYGDGGPADDAELYRPLDVVTDAVGNVYIADNGNDRVRIVDPSGTIRTFAGGGRGTVGDGDGGPATQARLSDVVSLAMGPGGSLLLSDGSRIREVPPSGVIRTIAGGAQFDLGLEGLPATLQYIPGPRGLAMDAAGNILVGSGNVWTGSDGDHRVRRIDPARKMWFFAGSGADSPNVEGAPATRSMLWGPSDVAAAPDGGYFVAHGGIISHVAPDGSMRTVIEASSDPCQRYSGLSVASDGTLFYGDTNSCTRYYTVRMRSPSGERDYVANDLDGIGPISDVAALPDGDVLIASGGGIHRASRPTVLGLAQGEVRQLMPGAEWWQRCPDPGTPGEDSDPSHVSAIAVDALGTVYFASCNRIMRLNADGSVTRIAGSVEAGATGDGGPAIDARFDRPTGLAAVGTDLLVADLGNHRIRRVAGGIVTTVAGTTAGFSGDGGPATLAQFVDPADVSVAPDDALLIADPGNDRIRRVAGSA